MIEEQMKALAESNNAIATANTKLADAIVLLAQSMANKSEEASNEGNGGNDSPEAAEKPKRGRKSKAEQAEEAAKKEAEEAAKAKETPKKDEAKDGGKDEGNDDLFADSLSEEGDPLGGLENEEPQAEAEPEVTFDDVKAWARKAVDAKKQNEARALLSEFKAAGLPALKAEQYGPFVKKLKALLA